MHYFHSRWIDLRKYKTKEILLSVVTESHILVIPANRTETSYKCLCPFHKEKTPSMKFYFQKSYGWGYKCFGCGISGDVFSFLMKYNKWEFWEAVVYIVKKKSIFTYRLEQRNTFFPNWIQLKIPFPYYPEDLELPF